MSIPKVNTVCMYDQGEHSVVYLVTGSYIHNDKLASSRFKSLPQMVKICCF